MKLKVLVLTLIAFIGILAVLHDGIRVPPPPPSSSGSSAPSLPAPDFSFADLSGRKRSLYALPEKGIVLHFWASWCAPCALEFPSLLREMKKREGDVALVAVSIDEDKGAMERFLAKQDQAKNNISFYPVWDPRKEISLPFGTVAVPETIFIGSDHRMVGKLPGGTDWNNDAMQRLLQSLAD